MTDDFDYTWEGDNPKTPESILFPDGEEKRVQYMRDGIILFANGDSAEYTRKGQFSITVNPITSRQQAIMAAFSYRAKQQKGL